MRNYLVGARMDLGLDSKVILVTGASGSLGGSLCKALLQEGAVVFGCYNRHSDKICNFKNPNFHPVKLDITSKKEVDSAVLEIVKRFLRIDGLVNCAGVTKDKLIVQMNQEMWDEVLNVNLKAVYVLASSVLKHMMRQRSGKIINIVSRVGVIGAIGQGNYSASKAGVIALTKTIAKEIGAFNVTANVIVPGFFDSDMTCNLPVRIKDGAKTASVLGTISESSEIADFITYLLSEKVKKISGQVFHVDSRI